MSSQILLEQAVALHRQGSLAEAERLYLRLLDDAPDTFAARHLLGVARAQTGRMEQALSDIAAALALQPGEPEALLNYGNVLRAMGRREDALAAFDMALAAKPDFAQALTNRGGVLKMLGRFEEALSSYDRALALAPGHAETLNNRGSVLQDLKRPAEALDAYGRALAIQPQFPAALNNRGSALLDLRRASEALDSFDRALALMPGDAETISNRGNALHMLGRNDEALAAYDKALALRPDYAQGWNNRGSLLQEMKRHDAALDSFDRALALDPHLQASRSGAVMAALSICDWDRADALTADIRNDSGGIAPWTLLAISDDAQLQKTRARAAILERFGATPAPAHDGPAYNHDRIRLAYISSDFCQHPVAQQIAQLVESHDRQRFEVIGIATGRDDASALRARLSKGFDRFLEVQGQSPRAIADQIRQMEVDVLVDLNGHTSGDAFDVLRLRPAPVQATWLGYAGTLGADFVDSIIADAIVAPDDGDFTEQVVRLPGSFFVADTGRAIGTAPTRAREGLPDNGFVFCCFNNNWKITRPVFALWMRLLQGVPGSVLWLKKTNAAATAALKRAAQAAGVAPERLVFAGHAEESVHLARHALADLFLDTAPYNAHATACDALWAGLPVLTCMGNAYAARVAASLLTAVELEALITTTPQDYETLALALARDPARLKRLRDTLASARSRASLFDTPRFARNLEAALITLLPVQSGNANALFRRGVAFQHLENHDAALADYRALVAQNPRLAPVQNNLGNVLRGLKRNAEALAAFDAALAAKPDYAIARYNRGETLMAMMRTEEAFADFRQAARHFNAEALRDTVRPHKAIHDTQQEAWLAQHGITVAPGTLHLESGARLAGPAINPANAAEVAKTWDTSDPQLVVIDNLLTPEALAAVRRFCWGSTMWRKAHADGYLGAFPENGFAVPLLAQIAEEMRAVFPTMLKDYPLLYAWAFKYGSAIQGTAIHADSAAVNVNFWITPDEANLDPDHGGLVVWDKVAPLEWDFARFNGDIPAARQFLADTGAKPITVPYRANRAVIFDSDLFHETDTIRFKDGYENRRINVTMLFGDRHQS